MKFPPICINTPAANKGRIIFRGGNAGSPWEALQAMMAQATSEGISALLQVIQIGSRLSAPARRRSVMLAAV